MECGRCLAGGGEGREGDVRLNKYDLYREVERFWDANKSAAQSERSGLVSEFIDDLYDKGYVNIQLDGSRHHWLIKHPDIRRKASQEWIYSAFDILADFIMNTRMRTEKAEPNPVYTPEADFLRYLKRKQMNVSLDAIEDAGGYVDESGRVHYPDAFEDPEENAA